MYTVAEKGQDSCLILNGLALFEIISFIRKRSHSFRKCLLQAKELYVCRETQLTQSFLSILSQLGILYFLKPIHIVI